MFQSHNGAIAANLVLASKVLVEHCFNPTMVRLLPKSQKFTNKTTGRFQSHNGAIAAAEDSAEATRWLGFNPTMVRLLLGLAAGN